MKCRIYIVALLALTFSYCLMAAEESVCHDEASLSSVASAFSYDVHAVAVSDLFEDESENEGFALSGDFCRKVGQPTPGIMFSLLLAGGLAKLLLRLKKRADRKVMMVLARIMSAMKIEECKNALKIYATVENKYCLRRQMVELRL